MTVFHRGFATATNGQANNIIKNAIYRLAQQDKNDLDDKATVAFVRRQMLVEKSSISLAADRLHMDTPTSRTVLTAKFMRENQVRK